MIRFRRGLPFGDKWYNKEWFIIGGATLYNYFLTNQIFLEFIYRTRINSNYNCDTFLKKEPDDSARSRWKTILLKEWNDATYFEMEKRKTTKRIYSFHVDIVKAHITELKLKNETIIKSVFIFELFKSMIDVDYKVEKFRSDTEFYIGWSGTLGRRKHRKPNIKYILHLIDRGCFDIEQIRSLLQFDYYVFPSENPPEEIDSLFDKSTSKEKRLDILGRMSDEYCKCGFLSGFIGHKMYYRLYINNARLVTPVIQPRV
jgi:hypothetical protein